MTLSYSIHCFLLNISQQLKPEDIRYCDQHFLQFNHRATDQVVSNGLAKGGGRTKERNRQRIAINSKADWHWHCNGVVGKTLFISRLSSISETRFYNLLHCILNIKICNDRINMIYYILSKENCIIRSDFGFFEWYALVWVWVLCIWRHWQRQKVIEPIFCRAFIYKE